METKKIKENILWIISRLRQKPRTIHCGEDDYLSCRTFIEGYLLGLSEMINFNFSVEITDWLAKKYKVTRSTPYVMFPEYFHKEKSDEEKKELLLDLLEEYFNKKW